jgi:hypothetical protein
MRSEESYFESKYAKLDFEDAHDVNDGLEGELDLLDKASILLGACHKNVSSTMSYMPFRLGDT